MNNKYSKILFLAIGVASLTSCSTAYKMGQTPDDVYYSPAREQKVGYASTRRQDDSYLESQPSGRYQGYNNNNTAYNDYSDYRNDRFLRMSMGSSLRLSAFDDYYWSGGYNNFGYNSFGYNNYAYSYGNPWNSYYYWNSYYNPYSTINLYTPFYSGYGGYGNVIGVNPKASINPALRPRAFNPGSYTSNSYNNSNLYLYRNSTPTRPGTNGYNNSNRNYGNSYYNNSNSGNTYRRQPLQNTYFNNSNSNNSRSTYTPPSRSTFSEAPSSSRSYSPSSSSGSSSGGGVSRPSRGN